MRIGMLGAGGMAQAHAGVFGRMKGVEVAVFFGRHAARVAATAKRFGASATTDLDRILDDETIDAIDLVVPSGSHRGLAIAALERGKHVFCETPLALTLEDADAMIRTARRSRRLLLCAQLMRFVPQYAHARGVAASGRLGRPVVGVASRLSRPYWTRKDPRPFATYGEPVVELSIFDFNFLNWVFGRPISVSASGLRGDRGAADYVLATVQYTRAIGLVEGSARMPQNYPLNTRMRLLFEQGLLEADFRLRPKGFTFSYVEFSRRGKGKTVPVSRKDPYQAECEYFVAAVRGKADPSLIDAVHDRDALRVALAARESLRSGGPVPLRW